MKPRCRLRISESSSSSSCETSRPARKYWPGGRPVEAAQQVEQGALARARGAHDGHEIAFGKIDRHAAQRADDDPRLRTIVLRDVDDLGGHFHGESLRCALHAGRGHSWRRASIGSIGPRAAPDKGRTRRPRPPKSRMPPMTHQAAIRGSSCWMFGGSEANKSG